MLEAARPISYKRERFRESGVRDLGFIGHSKMFPLMFWSPTTFFLPSNLVSVKETGYESRQTSEIKKTVLQYMLGAPCWCTCNSLFFCSQM